MRLYWSQFRALMAHVEMVNEGWEMGKLNDALALLTLYCK